MPKKYYISKSNVYQEVTTKLFTTYSLIDIPNVDNLHPLWHGKKIPYAMWQEILAFMKHSYDELKSETMLFLYYDENKDKPWSFWVPPQITNGMTVKSNPDHAEFQTQRAQYPDTMFGTVHHHCSTSAFQSGTDEADETNREGFHFTIGNLNKPKDIDIHFRWCLDNECHELEDLSIAIDGTQSPFKKGITMTDEMLDMEIEYRNASLSLLPKLDKYDFTKQMANVERPTYTVPSYSKKNTSQLQTALPLVTEEELTIGDILDEIIFDIKFDGDIESAIQMYLSIYEQDDANQHINSMFTGTLYDTEYAGILKRMLSDSEYRLSADFQEFQNALEKHLDEFKSKGYIISEQDLIYELGRYEEGEPFQPMVDETIL